MAERDLSFVNVEVCVCKLKARCFICSLFRGYLWEKNNDSREREET